MVSLTVVVLQVVIKGRIIAEGIASNSFKVSLVQA
jgi:hypothetical protein